MSGGDEAATAANLPAVQKVGYGNPPVEHRFRKGQSGNPSGRPRGVKNKESGYDPAELPTSRMILEEAYRSITIREGDRVIELPAIQAVMRAMGVSAMKGNRLAQKTLAEIVQRVEAEEQRTQLSALENAIEYKLQWTREIERCRKLGLPDPEPLPHPDDIVLDMRRGKVRTEGPLSKEEKENYDIRIARRTEAQEEVSHYAERYRRARSPSLKARWLEAWHFEQRIFDVINDSLPPRYKVQLVDRSQLSGATSSGTALRDYLAEQRGRKRANDNDEAA